MGILDRISGIGGGNLIFGFIILGIFTVVGIGVVSLLLTQLFDVTYINVGPALALIAVGSTIALAVAAGISPTSFDRAAIVPVLILAAVVVFMFWLFPWVMPDLIENSMSLLKVQTMSVLGLG